MQKNQKQKSLIRIVATSEIYQAEVVVKEAKAVAKLRAIRRAFETARLHYGERHLQKYKNKWEFDGTRWVKKRKKRPLYIPHPATLSVKIERA